MSDDPEVAGELLNLPGARTGLVVGLGGPIPQEHAVRMREQLEERFPGVTVAVVDQCSALTSFSFDPPEEAP